MVSLKLLPLFLGGKPSVPVEDMGGPQSLSEHGGEEHILPPLSIQPQLPIA
jgi:hypothetical protein